MGINLSEISQKVLDNNTNAANVFRKMYDLHYNPNPLDVPFEYIDENGNKVTTTIKNVAGFRKRIWDDVGGALGQFSRTFYVDADNGDDSNAGSSDSPFKTIKKAVNSTPVGGKAIIRLKGDFLIEEDYFDVHFTADNKMLRFYKTDDNGANVTFKWVADSTNAYQAIAGFAFNNCYVVFGEGINFYETGFDDNLTKSSFRSIVNRYSRGSVILFTYNTIEMENMCIHLADVSNVGNSIEIYQPNLKIDPNNTNPIQLSSALISLKYTNSSGYFKDFDDNDLDPATYLISGVIKDADSGNPINVISNINFSS